jgi:two-component system NarL family sensor kinase
MPNMEIKPFIIIMLIAMLVMAFGVILFVVLYQRRVIKHQLDLKLLNAQKELDVLKASIQSEEEERKRIAQELHDDVGATLSSARLFLNSQASHITEEQITISKKLIDNSLSKIRMVSYKLQPNTLINLGLQSALENMMEMLNKSGKVKATFEAYRDIPRMESYAELHVYRVIQELITNITKYADASQIDLTINMDTGIRIILIHDGNGMTNYEFDTHIKSHKGQGLKNIANRLRIVQGEIEFMQIDDYYRILICIPLSNEKIEKPDSIRYC